MVPNCMFDGVLCYTDISTILSRCAWTLTSDIGDLFTELTFIVLLCFSTCALSCIVPACSPSYFTYSLGFSLQCHRPQLALTGTDKDCIVIFTAQCTLVQMRGLGSHVVCLSVCLSVCDVGDL